MATDTALSIGITISSIVLVVLILLQQRGGGLGTLFGGGSSDSYRTKRGAEKFVYYATILFGIIWVGLLVSKMIFS